MMSVVEIIDSPVIFCYLDTINTEIPSFMGTVTSVLISLTENDSSVTKTIVTFFFSAD